MKTALISLMAVLALSACGSTEPSTTEPPAYMPEEMREAQAKAAAQAEQLNALMQDSAWDIVDVTGQAMMEDAPATLNFSNGETVSGATGCNSFNGGVTLDSAQISIGPLASTRMLCPEALMAQERLILETLGRVITAGIDEDGVLFLSTLEGELVRLAPQED